MFHSSKIVIPQNQGAEMFRHQGNQSGPSLAVVGHASDMAKIAARISKIPSLAYMRGSIAIYAIGDDDFASHLPDADAVLVLMDGPETHATKSLAALYWKVLARAASLGIIAGRGVPVGPTRVTWH